MPRLSVIIPTFRCPDLLVRCLDGIAACLPHVPDIEVLVQDGAGDAATADAARAFETRIPGLRLESAPDQGLYHAMNRAMDRATGDWLLFLGADDEIIAPAVLPRLLAAANPAAADIVQADILIGANKTTPESVVDWTISPSRLFASQGFCHQAFLYRRAFVGALRYDTAYPVCADGVFNLETVVAKKARVRAVHEVLVRYANTGLSSHTGDPVWKRNRKTLMRKHFPRKAFVVKALVSPVRETLRIMGKPALTRKFTDFAYGFLDRTA